MASKSRALKSADTSLISKKSGYVAFLDILGFKELLSKPNHAKIIGDMVDALRERVEYDEKHYTRLAYISISDSIIITADDGEGLGLVRKIAQVQTALLKQGFAVRGAISHGPILTYSGTMGRNIFGKTYLSAYQAEQAMAIYPRVVLEHEETANKIWADIKEETDRSASTYMSRDKSDGVWFVNQFSSQVIGRNSKALRNRDRAEEERAIFAGKIKLALAETENDPRAHMKWRWLNRHLADKLPLEEKP